MNEISYLLTYYNVS